MLPAPTDHVDVIPPSTIAPPVRGLFEIPMYFGQIQVYGDLYRSDPQRYPLYRVFDRQPVSRAPDGTADPQKVHYVPPDPDPWVAVVYQQRQRRIENQQRASDQQIRPEIQQAQSQQRQQQQPEGNQQASAKTNVIENSPVFLDNSKTQKRHGNSIGRRHAGQKRAKVQILMNASSI